MLAIVFGGSLALLGFLAIEPVKQKMRQRRGWRSYYRN